MASRLSRRLIARHTAEQIEAGNEAVLAQVAAHLIETRRTGEADLIVRDIEAALAAKGVVVADVATARQLDKKLAEAIEAFVKTTTSATSVHMRQHVDESLIGGVRVRTPDAEHDATVRRQLTKLQAMKV